MVAGLSIVTIALLSMFTKAFQFWPPPRENSWQYHSFWWLFRVMFVGVLFLSYLDFHGLGEAHPLVTPFGVILCLLGFGAAFRATFSLGWKNAHGAKEGLKTVGWYKWSRNPIYVSTILGILGFCFVVNSGFVYALGGLWSLLYLAAPFFEEPWLEKTYGHEYVLYKAKVSRFVGRA